MGFKPQKKRTAAFALFLAAALTAGTFAGCAHGTPGGESPESVFQEGAAAEEDPQTAMGRYMETELNLNEDGQTQDFHQLMSGEGEMYVPAFNSPGAWVDTDAFACKEGPDTLPEPLKKRLGQEYFTEMAVADNNARMYIIFVTEGENDSEQYYYDKYFLDAEGEEHPWEDAVDRSTSVNIIYGGDGWFYAAEHLGRDNARFYRVNAESGETEYLCEMEGSLVYYTVFGGMLFVDMHDGIHLFDLDRKQEAEEDTALSDFLKSGSRSNNGNFGWSYLIRPGKDGSIYVASDKGLYRHVLYGSAMEQMIDGSLCSLSDISKLLIDMAVEESESGMPIFYLLYDSGKLIRFTYDPEMPSVPDKVVTVYSLYADDNIRRVISGWQKKRPDVYVDYEIGVSGTDGVTRDDALKNLATRLAAGEGPDVLMMDDLPYASYREKGALLELGDLYEELKGEYDYFDNIIEALRDSGKLYCMPMSFDIPMITGKAETLAGIDSVEDLLQAVKEPEDPAGSSRAGMFSAEGALLCLTYSMGQSLVNEDGTLNREKLTLMLEQAKELYEADGAAGRTDGGLLAMKTFGSLDAQMQNRQTYYRLRYLQSMLMVDLAYGGDFDFNMGVLDGNIRNGFNDAYAVTQKVGHDYALMPGDGKVCLPLTLLGVNSAAAAPEEAKEFVRYALSDYLMETEYMNGFPINRDALIKNEENPGKDAQGNPSYEPYVWHSFSVNDGAGPGDRIDFEVTWCRPEVYEKFNALLDGLDTVNLCDMTVLATVLEEGAEAVDGTRSIEETVDAIGEKLQLYLAE